MRKGGGVMPRIKNKGLIEVFCWDCANRYYWYFDTGYTCSCGGALIPVEHEKGVD